MEGKYVYSIAQERISSIVLLLVGIGAFYEVGQLSAGAQLFPRIISGALILCAFALFIRSFFKTQAERVETEEAKESDRPVYIALGLAVLYVIATDYLGFISATLLFIPASAFCLGLRNWITIAATTIIFVGLTAFLFRHVFYVILPPDLLFRF